MSCLIGDENNDSCTDLLHSLLPSESRLDSGYLTFASPSCVSPSRLSPSSVFLSQLDSPLSEHETHSPIIAAKSRFLSTIDYERYISTRKHFDILSQLHHRNTSHLIDTILFSLSSIDRVSCAKVSRNWNFIIKEYHRRKKTKKVKRNLFNQQEKVPIRKSKLTSTPMQTITNVLNGQRVVPLIVESTSDENIHPSTCFTNSSPEKTIHLTASAMTFRYGYLKYLHGPTVPKRCPLCAYVSIVDVNDKHGICTNPLCRNSFCQCCSGPYHPSSPCKTTTGPIKSPWRQRPAISPIFSNKTRVNLRRLL